MRTETPMAVEDTKSSARKPTRSRTEAISRICAVERPVALQLLWLPSRQETSMSSMSAIGSVPSAQKAGEKRRVHPARRELRVHGQGGVKAEIGIDAFHMQWGERAGQPASAMSRSSP